MNLKERPKQLALVVEDDDVTRMLAAQALRQAGLDVIEAATGEEGLALVGRQMPDVVLLDVQLPGLDGFDVCAEVRQRGGAEHLPVVMMTGLDDAESVARAYDVGATDFITKPIHWQLLLQRVRYVLRSAAAFRELAESRARLAKNEAELAAAHRIAGIATWDWDRQANAVRWSDSATQILSSNASLPVSASSFLKLVHKDDRVRVKKAFGEAAASGVQSRLELRYTDSAEQVRMAEVQFEATTDRDRSVRGFRGTARDLTDRWRAEQRIEQLAYYDTLTGLPNRQLFEEYARTALARSAHTGAPLGILFVDLNGFKRINDTFGHSAGDAVLRTIADRLRNAVRERTDGKRQRDCVARLAGDEFVVLLEDADAEIARDVSRRVLEGLLQPLRLGREELLPRASIGIAVYPDDGADYDLLLNRADQAMYRDKARARAIVAASATEAVRIGAYTSLAAESRHVPQSEEVARELHVL